MTQCVVVRIFDDLGESMAKIRDNLNEGEGLLALFIYMCVCVFFQIL